MISTTHSNFVAKLLSGILLVVTVFTWKSGTDPVNVPKEFALVTGAMFLLGVSLTQLRHIKTQIENYAIVAALFFIFCLFIPVFLTDSPLTHQIFGVLGRSLGLLTYISFGVLFIVACTNRSPNLFKLTNIAFQFSFIYNCFICLFQLTGVELLGYNNVFRVPLGTFGNPNFISAFLGIFASFQLAFIFSKQLKLRWKLVVAVEILIAIAFILETNSRQGLLIILASMGLVVFYWIRFKFQAKVMSRIYIFLVTGLGLLVALGVFNFGPLANLIYKTSISFRIEYWKAALNMGMSNPFTGVGLNSYGDWYRFFRNPTAIVNPGPEIVTNSAHNIPLDFLATGGFPLFVAYLFLQLVVIVSIFRITLKLKSFDYKIVSLIAAWSAFTLQSLISIDQIGVSIWGWVVGGLIIGYGAKMNLIADEPTQNIFKTKEKVKTAQIPTSIPAVAIVSGSILGLIGMLLSIPNFRADLDWGRAMRTGDINTIKSAAENWPQDEMRLGTAAFIFGNNQLWDEAIVFSNKTLDFNPRSYSVWRMLMNNPRADIQVRRNALSQLQKLDPNNDTLPEEFLEEVKSP